MTTVMTYNSLQNDISVYLDRDDAELIAMIPEFITLAELRCAREVRNLGTKTSVVSVFQPGKGVYIKPANWLETISINFGDSTLYNTVSRQATSGTCTLTLLQPHDFNVGDQISVFNVGNSNYNGNFAITAITQYSVTYVTSSFTEALTADTGGIVCAPLDNRVQLRPRSLEYCNFYWPNRLKTGDPKFYADYNYNNYLIVTTPQIACPFEITAYVQPQFLSETNQENWWTQYARDLLLYACLLETAPYLKDDQRVQVWQDRYDRAKMAIQNQNRERVNDSTIMRMEDE